MKINLKGILLDTIGKHQTKKEKIVNLLIINPQTVYPITELMQEFHCSRTLLYKIHKQIENIQLKTVSLPDNTPQLCMWYGTKKKTQT